MNFEAFWARYPKKMEKPLARKAYQRALKIASHEEIMAGLERFITAEPWKGDLHYCIFPERWLKRERWHDEYDDTSGFASVDEAREHGERLVKLRAVK